MKPRMEGVYAREKLGEAVRALAVGEEDSRHRLGWAARKIMFLWPDDFPGQFRAEGVKIMSDRSARGSMLGSDGTMIYDAIQNTVLHMRKKTASRIAQRILTLYFEVDHYLQTCE